MQETLAYVGFGSNMGNARENCLQAARALGESAGVVTLRLSSLYRTEPLELTGQDWYVNAVAEVTGSMSARDLFHLLRGIEDRMGRDRQAVRYGPRVIDLDILLYGNTVLETPGLIIPHPRLHERRFVLIPLCELSPDLEHPVFKTRMRDLLENLPEEGQHVVRMDEDNQ